MRKSRKAHTPLTAEQRTQFNQEREAVVGQSITVYQVDGSAKNYFIRMHVRGSQYEAVDASNQAVSLSHSKSKNIWRYWQ
jgi:hypothetical protein